MDKVIKDGKVAVLISPNFGAGWFSWNDYDERLLFSPKIVKMVQEGRTYQINESWIAENLGIEDVYCGGLRDIEINWIPIGTKFRVIEYDGNEELLTSDDLWVIA